MNISVIIPTYNAAPWIGRAIQSVLDQTVPVAEIIVVDDDSKDDTREVVKSFGAKVRYIWQTNGGPAKARNTAMAASTGEWLAFLDADDWWMPDKLEWQLAALRQAPDAILVYTALRMVEENGIVDIRPCTPPGQLWPQLRYRNPIPLSSVLMKRSALQQIGGFNERHRGTEDWEAWVRLRRVGAFTSVPEVVTCYRVAPTSLSGDGAHMFRDFSQMLDSTLVADLSGAKRVIWRRRILAYQAFSAAIAARSQQADTEALHYLLQSLREWPSPFWYPKRYVSLGIMLTSRHTKQSSTIPSPGVTRSLIQFDAKGKND